MALQICSEIKSPLGAPEITAQASMCVGKKVGRFFCSWLVITNQVQFPISLIARFFKILTSMDIDILLHAKGCTFVWTVERLFTTSVMQ